MTAPSVELLVAIRRDRYAERLKVALEEGGASVTAVQAAEGVISRLEYMAPDAFVIAVDLPGLRLFGLSRWIRSTRGFDAAPLIALVRSHDEEREATASSCDYVLRIPMSAAALAREIRVRIDLALAVRDVPVTNLDPTGRY